MLPEGSVYVQHYSTDSGSSYETHVFQSDGQGGFQALAYRWDSSESEAALVEQVRIEALAENPSVVWYSPGPINHLVPSQSFIGYHPQIYSLQFNVGSQIADWNKEGYFSSKLTQTELQSLDRMADLNDESASWEVKVRA